ncbi:phosphoribosyl-ATP diphosphatase [Candidatus Hodgkinia cicadicola]
MAIKTINATTRFASTAAPRLRMPTVLSYSSKKDKFIEKIRLNPNNTELSDIDNTVRSVVISSRSEDIKKSWINRVLNFGLCMVLKKINEEAAELVLAACAHRGSEVVMESADLVFHVILLLRPLDISFSSLAAILKEQARVKTQVRSLGVLTHLATNYYNGMVAHRNEQLLRGYRVESVISSIAESLYQNLFKLTFLSARTGISTYVNLSEIKNAIYNILFNVLLILNYRGISYQYVVHELYKRRVTKRVASAGK